MLHLLSKPVDSVQENVPHLEGAENSAGGSARRSIGSRVYVHRTDQMCGHQAQAAGQFAPVGEAPPAEDFLDEHPGALRADRTSRASWATNGCLPSASSLQRAASTALTCCLISCRRAFLVRSRRATSAAPARNERSHQAAQSRPPMMMPGRRLCSTSSAPMRFVCAMRSCVSRCSSRWTRRASSSSGLGSRSTDQTCSPAWWRTSIASSLSGRHRSGIASKLRPSRGRCNSARQRLRVNRWRRGPRAHNAQLATRRGRRAKERP